jgi:6-phosphogluconolactonase
MEIRIFDSENELINSMAEYFVALANKTIAKGQRFSVALSGGNSPKKLYALLASDKYKNKLDWDKTDFFFGDERYVPHNDDASNFKMANDVLLQPLNISPHHIFPVDTSLSPEKAAADYEKKISIYFKDKQPCFDLILLGLGDNSHTASLFPFTPILEETNAGVKAVYLEGQQLYRISFTAPLINLAKNIAFLVYGLGKETAVHHVLEGERNIQLYPAQLIKPPAGNLVWFLDKAAASKLTSITV